ncbi:MAG: isoaspartyl peptidase/L-asparaginase [bacterium]|nr:isoaspartyl peptidase/L-asparaginase [bacterium]
MLAIVVHGGASAITSSPEQKEGVRIAGDRGMENLRGGGHALDAVLAGGTYLEGTSLYNAGSGSLVRFDPRMGIFRIQMDAMIATSGGFQGGVIGVEGVKHPLLLAAEVPKRTPHLAMSWDEGLERIARETGLDPHPGPSEFAINRFLQSLSGMTEAEIAEMAPDWTRESILRRLEELHGSGSKNLLSNGQDCDTVAVLGLDSFGELAVGSSTGGMGTMWIGRVGDVIERGSGWEIGPYAVVATTGLGEAIKQDRVAQTVYRRIVEEGRDPDAVCKEFVAGYDPSIPLGVVALTIQGKIGKASNRDMPVYSDVEL